MLENVERILIRPKCLDEFKEILLKSNESQGEEREEGQDEMQIENQEEAGTSEVNEEQGLDPNLRGSMFGVDIDILV